MRDRARPNVLLGQDVDGALEMPRARGRVGLKLILISLAGLALALIAAVR